MSPPAVSGPEGMNLGALKPTARSVAVTEMASSPPPELQDDSTIQTVDELVRRRARTDPDKVIVSYPSSGIDYVDYTLKQLDVFAYRVAKYYEQFIPRRASSDEKPTTVAVLGLSDLDYLITLLALSKLGHTTLFLSTRISQEAIENLVRSTGAVYFLADSKHQDSAETAHKSLGMKGVLEIARQTVYDFPIEAHADTRMDQALDPTIETKNNIFIIHSSGSTGLPKPIYQTQKSAVANYAFSMKMEAFITLPLYHNHGICNLFRAIYSKKSLHLYNANLPLTHDYLTSIMRKHQFEIFYGVPYALKLLAESEEGMELLRRLKIVMYGGSACPDELGDNLVNNGVNLIGHYGATEVGQLMTSFRPPGDKDWNYVRERPELSPYLRWIPRGTNLYECCVLPGWPSKVASNQEDGSYCTKDLFEPHPTLPRAWKYIARRDDTIKLINGEMFNPVTTEGAIRSSKDVAEAVIFGAGRPSPGILVVPAASLAGKSDDEILNTVYPIVESACQNVEAYARISKDMVKILPHDCAYPRTDKGSVIRHAFYKAFAKEIEDVYDQADSINGQAQKLNLSELKDFVRKSIHQKLNKEGALLEDDTDFFSLGMDSLQAIQVRSEILKTVDIGGNKLGQTVVFDHPSITKLSSYLFSLGSGGDAEVKRDVESEMRDLIAKYSNVRSPSGDLRSTVLVTGVTGSLGAHIVVKLAADPTISTIFCLARARSDADAARRVTTSLLDRRLYHTMPLAHRKKLVALAADFSDPKLGLSDETYRKVRQNLRTVIHSAWAVNFNLHLSSFEKDNVAGISNLISLCHAAANSDAGTPAATFNFCSSVSTVARATVTPVPERAPDLEWAQGMGYAQSKCVAEHLCARAEARGVTARVLRIGQIIADSQHGVWNNTEAIPLMLQSALTIGALPKLHENPLWLPVDIVAQAVQDISLSDAGSVFTNVVNPKAFDWTNDLLPALKAAGLEFEAVEPKEWIRRLRASNPDPKANPPIKLVDFFASKYDKDEFAPSKTYITDAACSLSPSLANAPVLDQDVVQNFVDCFKAGAWAETAPASALAKPSKTVVFVNGSGKTGPQIASSLGPLLRVPVIEGDSLHNKSSADKLAKSEVLSEEEQGSWLRRLCKRSLETLEELDYDAAVVSCSIPKPQHHDFLRNTLSSHAQCIFLTLQGSTDESDGTVNIKELDVFPLNGETNFDMILEDVQFALKRTGVFTHQ